MKALMVLGFFSHSLTDPLSRERGARYVFDLMLVYPEKRSSVFHLYLSITLKNYQNHCKLPIAPAQRVLQAFLGPPQLVHSRLLMKCLNLQV